MTALKLGAAECVGGPSASFGAVILQSGWWGRSAGAGRVVHLVNRCFVAKHGSDVVRH